jgi:hypothetical protein
MASENGILIANAIQARMAIAMNNGSQKAQMGTSAFVIEGENSDEGRIVGVNIAPGNF